MRRLKMYDIQLKIDWISDMTGKAYKAQYWNGYLHIYEANNGNNLVTGTIRECYDFLYAFGMGYLSALEK